MTELTDRSIAALRANHDHLAALVGGLTPEQLTLPSGATEWTVAQVLSHLGSGAEITQATIEASLPDSDPDHDTDRETAPVDNQSVWDRWDAASPDDQATWFVEHDERLVAMLEGLSPELRDTVTVKMFLPEPVPLEVAVGMRLSEASAHAWDARVALNPEAGLDPESAQLLAEHYAGGLGFILGFAAKADRLDGEAVVALDGYVLEIDDTVRLLAGVAQDATVTFTGPLEAGIRLLSGRLRPEYTPAGADVTGNVTLDELRQGFPGY